MQDATTSSVPMATIFQASEMPENVLEYRRVDSVRPRKVARAELTGEFAGLWADVWTNPKRKVFKKFASGDGDSQDEVLAELVMAHNIPGLPFPLTLDAIGDMDADLYLNFAEVVAETLKAALAPPKVGESS